MIVVLHLVAIAFTFKLFIFKAAGEEGELQSETGT